MLIQCWFIAGHSSTMQAEKIILKKLEAFLCLAVYLFRILVFLHPHTVVLQLLISQSILFSPFLFCTFIISYVYACINSQLRSPVFFTVYALFFRLSYYQKWDTKLQDRCAKLQKNGNTKLRAAMQRKEQRNDEMALSGHHRTTGYRLAAEVNRQHSECVCIVFIYTHTPSAADSLRPRDGTQCIERGPWTK